MIAGVEPRFEVLPDDQDPVQFIYSANLMHRFLTKGQKAMAAAMMFPEVAKGGRGKKSEAGNGKDSLPFSKMRLSQARKVLAHSRPLADAVLSGNLSLDEALGTVQQDLDKLSSAEAKFDRLRKEAPALVERGRWNPPSSGAAVLDRIDLCLNPLLATALSASA